MAVANTVTNFQQTIWSKSILRSLEKITSLRTHCNFQFEKESKNAKEVKILSVIEITEQTIDDLYDTEGDSYERFDTDF